MIDTWKGFLPEGELRSSKPPVGVAFAADGLLRHGHEITTKPPLDDQIGMF